MPISAAVHYVARVVLLCLGKRDHRRAEALTVSLPDAARASVAHLSDLVVLLSLRDELFPFRTHPVATGLRIHW